MLNMSAAAVAKQPQYYVVFKVAEVSVDAVGLSAEMIGPVLYVVHFGDGELADPSAEPIGVFGDGKGDRCYQWRGKYWAEIDIDVRALASEIRSLVINRIPIGVTLTWRALYQPKHPVGLAREN